MIIFDTKYPFGYKNVMGDFVTFPEPVEITVWADTCDYEPQAPNSPQGGDQIQKATTIPPEDPIAAEDKFEPHRGYYGYSVKTFKNPSPQEIIEWNLLNPPWVWTGEIGVGVLDSRRFDPKFIKETARKNRFKRLHLIKRKIDERN